MTSASGDAAKLSESQRLKTKKSSPANSVRKSPNSSSVVRFGPSSKADQKHPSPADPVDDLAEKEVEDRSDSGHKSSPAKTSSERTSNFVKLVSATTTRDTADDEESFIKILDFREEDLREISAQMEESDGPAEFPPSPDDSPKQLRLTIPSEIPGANAPGLQFPATDAQDPEPKLATIRELFPLPDDPIPIVAPTDHPMTLEDLEELALRNSPLIAQALASITMSQGTSIQASLYPNPVAGYEADTVGSTFTRNYQGIYLSQQIKVAGKLGFQRAAANMDLANSRLQYDKTRQEVLHQVRVGYFNVLVAQESSRINTALVRFTNQVFVLMVGRLKRGEQAPYELAQLRTLVKQAKTTWYQSQNRHASAWKQLAVSTGTPELPLTLIEGRVDSAVPNLDYDAVLDRVLTVHPDLQAARNLLAQSKYQLQLQRAIPIPDPTVAGAFQNDFTAPGFERTSYNLNVSFPVPLYDRNQGNIRSALGRIEMTSRQYGVITNQLTLQLADAFERYQNGRVQSELFRKQILPDAARAYRGVFKAHINSPQKVGFSDIIVAQQNLSTGVGVYISSLMVQWIAIADIANLMQLDDFRSLLSSPLSGPDVPSEVPPAAEPRQGGQR